jgi:DNA-binding response OmpR family regulator
MNEILVCTHNPILMKGLYGILRDEGFQVSVADHAAPAVQMVLKSQYAAVIIDVQIFGLPVDDTVRIIKAISPETPVIVVGCSDEDQDGLSIKVPADLAEVRKVVHNVSTVSRI